MSSYRLDAFSPSSAELGTVGIDNPTLALELGKRYQVRVLNYSSHPLDILSKGSSSARDKVLLSMGSTPGTFESDPQVKWEDPGQGVVRFTLTASLYQAMIQEGRRPGYRCRLHPSTMRGDFTVAGVPLVERIGSSLVRIGLDTVASGLTAPVDLKPDPLGSDRLYVVDQAGLVHVIEQGKLRQEPFLDVRSRLVQPLGILGKFDVNDYDERGLLGFDFHPGFANSGSPASNRVYTYTSEPVQGPADFSVEGVAQMNHQSVVTEWQVAPDRSRVDPASARVLMRIDQPQFNHNGGMLIVADVGQDRVEEINIVPKGGNYGWRIKEGDFLFDPNGTVVGLPDNR